MKIKTAALTGRALRYAAAVALDMSFYKIEDLEWPDDQYWVIRKDGTITHAIEDTGHYSRNRQYVYQDFEPDNDDRQCANIIDEWHISLVWDGSCWIASLYDYAAQNWFMQHTHPTSRRIAALRCFVALKLGYEVEVPDAAVRLR